jgi:hypothetical protein
MASPTKNPIVMVVALKIHDIESLKRSGNVMTEGMRGAAFSLSLVLTPISEKHCDDALLGQK